MTREEELATLIAEQEADEKWGYQVGPQRAPTNHRRISLDYVYDHGCSAAEMIGTSDESLDSLVGGDETLIRRSARKAKVRERWRGDRLRKIRQSKGMSQRELCRRIGVHLHAVSEWESAKLQWGPSTARLAALCRELDVDREQLYSLYSIGWTRMQIVGAIRRWVRAHGEPPTENDWKGRATDLGVPGLSTIRRRFGTWDSAIAAAGFQPRGRGGSAHPIQSTRLRSRIRKRKRTAYLTPSQIAAAYVIYDREGLSLPQLADRIYERYGYLTAKACRTALHRAFHAEGFALRTRAAGIGQFFTTPEGLEERRRRSERATRQHAERRAGLRVAA